MEKISKKMFNIRTVLVSLAMVGGLSTLQGACPVPTGVVDSSLVLWLPFSVPASASATNCAPSPGNVQGAVWNNLGGGNPYSTYFANAPLGTGQVMAEFFGGSTSNPANAPIRTLDIPGFTLPPQFTVSLWTVQISNIQPWYARLFEGGGKTKDFQDGLLLGLNSANKTYQVSLADPNTNQNHELGSCMGGTPDIGQATMVTATYDGSSLRLYKNGNLVAGPCPATFSPTSGQVSGARIGAANSTAPQINVYGAYWGAIGSPRVYNRKLSDSEIMQNYLEQAN